LDMPAALGRTFPESRVLRYGVWASSPLLKIAAQLHFISFLILIPLIRQELFSLFHFSRLISIRKQATSSLFDNIYPVALPPCALKFCFKPPRQGSRNPAT
jgi:hypothetical protein